MKDKKDKEVIGTRIKNEEPEQVSGEGAEPVDDEALEAVNGGLRVQST